MILEGKFKNQLFQILQNLTHDIIIKASLQDDDNSNDVRTFLNEIAQMSTKIIIKKTALSRTPAFTISKIGEDARVEFAGLPLGHEFESFLLALRQIDGQLPMIKDSITSRLKKINRKISFETYVSLSCRNCPRVVQALNFLAIINSNISHTMIEGKMFHKERIEKNVIAVPTIFIDGKEFRGNGKSIEELLDKAIGATNIDEFLEKKVFDVLVVGGGPAGNSAAIYAARKGLNVGMVAENYGGKVMDIPAVENMISIPYIKGSDLIDDLEIHVNQYYVDIMENQQVVSINEKKSLIEIELKNSAILKSKTVILAVGATWKHLNVLGEKELYTKGVTNCPHCDGPLFCDKEVAVIGGGNQAIEGAIDLANQTKYVYVIDKSSILNADKILQDRLKSLSNIKIILNANIKEINGIDRVQGLTYIDRESNQKHIINVEGIFVQIGLVPNTQWLTESRVELNETGELMIDKNGMTNIPGVFAAGDCVDTAYKQIIISMGSGAIAALGASDYLIRQ